MKNIRQNIFHEDFKDFINSLNDFNVEYLLVGGYSVILHGYNRVTGDLDIWVNRTSDNYIKLLRAFKKFGLPGNSISENSFVNDTEIEVFTFGRPPLAIDIMTQVKGLIFEEAFISSEIAQVDDLIIRYIGYNHLITAKKASGRHKDLDDLEELEAINK